MLDISLDFQDTEKKDWGFKDPKTSPYDSTDWERIASRQPFFCQYQFYDTHRVNLKREDGKMYPFLVLADDQNYRNTLTIGCGEKTSRKGSLI